MERYRVRANFNGNLSSNPNPYQPKVSPLHPKPPLIPSYPIEDTELSIFDAERYFNEGNKQPTITKKPTVLENCDSSTNPRDSSFSSIDGYARNWRSRSFRSGPTSSSEASWNSQTGLLSNPPGSTALNVKAYPLTEKRKPNSPSLSASRKFFSCNCPCYGKKAIDVEEKYSEPKIPSRSSSVTKVESPVSDHVVDVAKIKISTGLNWTKDLSGFTFPILKPGSDDPDPDPTRNSLEIFRPQGQKDVLKDDDVASDTSSDLFEIESFSANPTYRRRDSLEEFQKIGVNAVGILQFKRSLEELAPSECYAPSEVSVEWSVTTAEPGFDRASVGHFSSALSDYGEVQFVRTEPDKIRSKKKGGLLSCKCESSVNVGPSPVRVDRPKDGLEVSRFGSERVQNSG